MFYILDGFRMKDIKYIWDNRMNESAVSINPNIKLPQFTYKKLKLIEHQFDLSTGILILIKILIPSIYKNIFLKRIIFSADNETIFRAKLRILHNTNLHTVYFNCYVIMGFVLARSNIGSSSNFIR